MRYPGRGQDGRRVYTADRRDQVELRRARAGNRRRRPRRWRGPRGRGTQRSRGPPRDPRRPGWRPAPREAPRSQAPPRGIEVEHVCPADVAEHREQRPERGRRSGAWSPAGHGQPPALQLGQQPRAFRPRFLPRSSPNRARAASSSDLDGGIVQRVVLLEQRERLPMGLDCSSVSSGSSATRKLGRPLWRGEDLALAPQRQVHLGQLEAVALGRDRVEPPARRPEVGSPNRMCRRTRARFANAPAQLVELR